MADSVSISWSYSITKDGETKTDSHSFTYTPASHKKGTGVTQLITTSWTALTFGDTTTLASFSIKNLDTVNYIEISTDSGGANPSHKIAAGRSDFILAEAVTYYARANTASVQVTKSWDAAS